MGIEAARAALLPQTRSGVAQSMPVVDSNNKSPGDQVKPGSKQTAENTCRKCKGTGRLDDKPCPDCGGSGKVTEIVGDA
jgi:DnaJ-class molecular chaperone